MEKKTKLKIVRIATGAAVCLSAFGVIMLCGRSANTHAASQFTHGLKVIGEAFGGGMYRGATVVAGAGVVASEVMDSAFDYILDDDLVAKAAGTPPPAADVDPEPRFSEYNDMTAFVDALRKWEARQPDADDDIVAQYDRWEEAQRARRAEQPVHPLWGNNVVSLDDVRHKGPLDYLDQDDLDQVI